MSELDNVERDSYRVYALSEMSEIEAEGMTDVAEWIVRAFELSPGAAIN